MTQDVAAARVLADKLAVERSEMVGTGRSKDRRMASDRREGATTIRSLLARVAALEEGLVQADLAIRAYPGATQEDVTFIRDLLDSQKGGGANADPT